MLAVRALARYLRTKGPSSWHALGTGRYERGGLLTFRPSREPPDQRPSLCSARHGGNANRLSCPAQRGQLRPEQRDETTT